jgi:hypothetical protein
MIVHNGNIFVVNRTSEFDKMSPEEAEEKIQHLERQLLLKAREDIGKKPISAYIAEVKKLYARLGLSITFVPKDKKGAVDVPVRVVERVKHERVRKNWDPNQASNYNFTYDVDRLREIAEGEDILRKKDKDGKEIVEAYDNLKFPNVAKDIYREAVSNNNKPYESLSRLEKIELNAMRGMPLGNEYQKKVATGKAVSAKSKVITETIDTYQHAIDDLYSKGKNEDAELVKRNLQQYKSDMGVD